MSLAEAVMEVVVDMEESADRSEKGASATPASITELRFFAKMLRAAVKASSTHHKTEHKPDQILDYKKHLDNLGKAEERFGSPQLIEVVDGPMARDDGNATAPTFIEVPPGGKPGDKLPLGRYVYRLGKDMKLHYDEDESKKLSPSKIIVSDR